MAYWLKQSGRIINKRGISNLDDARKYAISHNATGSPIYVHNHKEPTPFSFKGVITFTKFSGDYITGGWLIGNFWKDERTKKEYRINKDGSLERSIR